MTLMQAQLASIGNTMLPKMFMLIKRAIAMSLAKPTCLADSCNRLSGNTAIFTMFMLPMHAIQVTSSSAYFSFASVHTYLLPVPAGGGVR